jgi:L-threonylcarbamoyladenylate synthase
MRRLVSDPDVPDATAIAEAASVLRRGGIVAYPTDTLYGLAVDPRNDEAIGRLFAVKGRDAATAIALIAADRSQAEHAGHFGPIERRLAAAFWPGPLTIVVPAGVGLSVRLTRRGTLGVRVPGHAVARALAAGFGECITATSANRTGAVPPATPAEVMAAFADDPDAIDLLLDAGPAPGGVPSTIVEVLESGPALLRAGAIAWERVLESVE